MGDGQGEGGRQPTRDSRDARLICWVLLALLLLGAGCAESGPKRAAVSGRVLVDGKPLERGVINFFPVEGTVGPGAGCPIANGEYQLDDKTGPVVGTNRVEIRGFRKTGKKMADLMLKTDVDIEIQVVPPDYNEKSNVTKTIQTGNNEINFEIKGMRP